MTRPGKRSRQAASKRPAGSFLDLYLVGCIKHIAQLATDLRSRPAGRFAPFPSARPRHSPVFKTPYEALDRL